MADDVTAEVERERQVLIDGWRALLELDKHAEHSVGPIGDTAYCPGCSKFAGAILNGAWPRAALYVRCEQAKEWQRQVDAALDLVNR